VAKILVIDDSKMMRLYLQRCLEKAGYEVEEWVPTSAMEVADHITASAPDLILCDYQMPGCNGSTVARMVFKASPKTPLVIITAFRDDEMEAGLQKFGVKQILTKPIDPEALLEVVKEALAAE